MASSRPAHSRVGGVLYLLNLLAGLELPQVLAVDRRLAGRGLRWTLHHLAMFLTGGAADDAAVLAFAGVAPTGPLPWLQPDAVTDDEQAAVAECAATVVRELRLRLPIEGTDAELLAQVCQRPVEMTCDPGWIDVRFRLEDVSIDIRRAGLDRDPGWLPWLGVVLRFRYA